MCCDWGDVIVVGPSVFSKKKILWQGSSGEREKGESHQTSCRNKRGLPKTKTIPSRLKHPSHKHTAQSPDNTNSHTYNNFVASSLCYFFLPTSWSILLPTLSPHSLLLLRGKQNTWNFCSSSSRQHFFKTPTLGISAAAVFVEQLNKLLVNLFGRLLRLRM